MRFINSQNEFNFYPCIICRREANTFGIPALLCLCTYCMPIFVHHAINSLDLSIFQRKRTWEKQRARVQNTWRRWGVGRAKRAKEKSIFLGERVFQKKRNFNFGCYFLTRLASTEGSQTKNLPDISNAQFSLRISFSNLLITICRAL